jgi:membrane protease YdiL (CAAX protease family)
MSKHDPIPVPPGYWRKSQRPLQALMFLLPMIMLYELAVPYLGEDRLISSDIYARRLLYRFFESMGVTGYYLPGLIVVAVLLCWHIAKKDPWKLEWKIYGIMLGESILLAAPLFVMQMVLFSAGALQEIVSEQAPAALVYSWQTNMIFAIGAGIYEEMLFRLIAITLFHMVLVDFLKSSNKHAIPVVISLSAILFAFYHFPTFQDIEWGMFLFYTIAGMYFSCIFIVRGFGIVAGTHAMYDVLVVLLELMNHD